MWLTIWKLFSLIFKLQYTAKSVHLHCPSHITQWNISETKRLQNYGAESGIFFPWASCQIRQIAGIRCAGNAGNVFPATAVSNPDMHHGTCVTHVTWCMPGSLIRGFLWIRRRGHSLRMRNPKFYVSGERPMGVDALGPSAIWTDIVSQGTGYLG